MRQIEKKMVDYLDKKLAGNGLFQHALGAGDPRMLFVMAMESCVGVREVGGNNKGPLVELMQKTIGEAGREPWCMSMVQTCLAYAELKTGIHSPIAASEHCLTVWAQTPKVQRVKTTPARGAVVIWQHGTTQNGHTGIVFEYGPKTMITIEGNTESGITPGGKVERDGGGVYICNRGVAGNGRMKVVGFLKPF